jgi:tRNA (mo5U34)-methyltransferase
VELDRRVPLAELSVLELGCFEGIHTAALCERAAHVVAIDSRVENVVKTAARCAVLGYRPELQLVDLEDELPADLDLSCDVLHHVGVLYHLTDPVEHLTTFAGLTRRGLMLDTHVAPENGPLERYRSGDREWRYLRFVEAGRSSPFAGMREHAKWLVLEELVELLGSLGFAHVDVAEERAERNGPRVLIYAER